LVSECEKLGIEEHILFAPHVPYEDLPSVYGAADILVMPSFVEGFGLPVLEAMACGTPVVCSRAASLPEVAGDAAEYFDPTSVDDLAATLERVLESRELQERLRCKGLERVKLFSWRECARKTLDVYRSALQE
jgi:glycosyltransferase involved in cell wall biosynthesis